MKEEFYSIGLMSGSSLDGLDICYSKISEQDNIYDFNIICFDTYAYSEKVLKLLTNIRSMNIHDLMRFDVVLAELFASFVKDFISKNNISCIDFVVNHGHTVFHFPEEKISKQIANNLVLSKHLNLKVIGDLRNNDILNGGQGAPIVPITDYFLFNEYKYNLNLGGICNISIQKNNSIIAFDISPCNQVLNHYSNILGYKYDDKGLLAKKGKFDKVLFEKLNNIDFYKIKYPKSLDNGFVANKILPIIEQFDIDYYSKLCTYIHHVSYQIATTIEPKSIVLCCGGGAYNNFLVEMIEYYSKSKIIIPSKEIVEQKEALAMCFFGVRRIQNKFNTFGSVTGANKNTIGGTIYEAI